MHAWNVVAWTSDGAVYCPDCEPETDGTPVFADGAEDMAGSTCDACGACYVSGEWVAHEDATDRRYTAWSRCGECNGMRPYRRRDEYRAARRAAGFKAHRCADCGKVAARFHV